jgi:transposase, IS30 family
MVERETKITILVLLDGITLEATKEGIIRRLTSRKKHVLTLTSDNGKEFPSQSEISEKFGSAFYFCTPYLSWERGLDENTNWLVRKYLL